MPSKTKKKSKSTAELSRFRPKSPESLIGEVGEINETEDLGMRDLDWLISAFPRLSLDQIDSAYKESGEDAYKASGILGAELVDPEESPNISRKKRIKKKRVAASTGMVSGVVTTDHWKSALSCNGRRRGWGDPVKEKERAVWAYSGEEAEEFLCSMLSSDSELGMGVVRDVLSQCGYELEKALDALLDISKLSKNHLKEIICIDDMEGVSSKHREGSVKNSESQDEMLSKIPSRSSPSSFRLADNPPVSTCHPSAKEHDSIRYVGSGCRDYLKVPLNTEDQLFSTTETVNHDLQQMVLESLFMPKSPNARKNMRWKEIVKRVESFGQGMVFNFEDFAEPLSKSRIVDEEEDGYNLFRSAARNNWNKMSSYYRKAALEYSRGQRSYASYLSEKGKFYKNLAHEADEKASQEIFKSRNKGIRNTVTIDLHGQHVKQAVRLLKLHLLLFAYIPSVQFLRVITGCGADSLGLGRLKRTVLELAQKEGIKWNEENSGTLLLSIGSKRSFTFIESEIDSDES